MYTTYIPPYYLTYIHKVSFTVIISESEVMYWKKISSLTSVNLDLRESVICDKLSCHLIYKFHSVSWMDGHNSNFALPQIDLVEA